MAFLVFRDGFLRACKLESGKDAFLPELGHGFDATSGLIGVYPWLSSGGAQLFRFAVSGWGLISSLCTISGM